MFDWVTDLWNGITAWMLEIWNSIVEFFTELPILILDGVLSSVATLIENIPVPEFLINGGLQSYLVSIDPGVLYFLDRSGFDAAIAILGTGVTFRLTRKIMTLGRW